MGIFSNKPVIVTPKEKQLFLNNWDELDIISFRNWLDQRIKEGNKTIEISVVETDLYSESATKFEIEVNK